MTLNPIVLQRVKAVLIGGSGIVLSACQSSVLTDLAETTSGRLQEVKFQAEQAIEPIQEAVDDVERRIESVQEGIEAAKEAKTKLEEGIAR